MILVAIMISIGVGVHFNSVLTRTITLTAYQFPNRRMTIVYACKMKPIKILWFNSIELPEICAWNHEYGIWQRIRLLSIKILAISLAVSAIVSLNRSWKV